LKAPDGFFHQLVDIVVKNFGDAFPELTKNPERVKKVILAEENLFTRSLTRGINKFNSLTKTLRAGDVLSGEDTFLLYGTFGFPLDLLQIMSGERGFSADTAQFEELLHRNRMAGQNVSSF